jgi:metal-dependent amidase/aminoacylase/carboxypeptidase family protein
METTRAEVLDALKAYEPELIAIRRDIHRHPETAFEETRTARIVADKLRDWGIDVAEGLAKTGVVGTVRGRRPGPRAIALRADLDALHIEEAQGPGKDACLRSRRPYRDAARGGALSRRAPRFRR